MNRATETYLVSRMENHDQSRVTKACALSSSAEPCSSPPSFAAGKAGKDYLLRSKIRVVRSFPSVRQTPRFNKLVPGPCFVRHVLPVGTVGEGGM